MATNISQIFTQLDAATHIHTSTSTSTHIHTHTHTMVLLASLKIKSNINETTKQRHTHTQRIQESNVPLSLNGMEWNRENQALGRKLYSIWWLANHFIISLLIKFKLHHHRQWNGNWLRRIMALKLFPTTTTTKLMVYADPWATFIQPNICSCQRSKLNYSLTDRFSIIFSLLVIIWLHSWSLVIQKNNNPLFRRWLIWNRLDSFIHCDWPYSIVIVIVNYRHSLL